MKHPRHARHAPFHSPNELTLELKSGNGTLENGRLDNEVGRSCHTCRTDTDFSESPPCFQSVSESPSGLKKAPPPVPSAKDTVKSDQLFEKQLVRYKEAARYLRLSETHLRRLKSEGKIPFVPVGSRGVRFRVSSLNAWIAEREIK